MVDNKTIPKMPTRVTKVGNNSTYIRVPSTMIKDGSFPFKRGQPLILAVESKGKIVITPVK